MIKRVGDDGCKNCILHTFRPDDKVVKNWVNTEAEICFMGMAPGSTETFKLEPFVGDAGQKLRKQIVATGLDLADI